jgi:hypothetical protein
VKYFTKSDEGIHGAMQIYVPVLLLIGFVVLNAVAIILISSLITRGQPNPAKS